MEQIECPNDRFLQEDLESIASSDIPIEEMKNSTVLITGASGLIGAQLVRALACCNRLKNINIKILAMVRNKNKAKLIYGDLLNRDVIQLVLADITTEFDIEGPVDYIFHCASVTTSKVMVEKPVETIITSIVGTNNILKLAKDKRTKSVVYVSSMEMYGTFTDCSQKVNEDMLGYINPLKLRSNYPESKRMCENMCKAYLSEYEVPVKIARLAQTFGAGILPGENRVFAQFARAVLNGENIVLNTYGRSEGNYCYTSDAIRALIILLIKGKNGEAYNISNEDTHTTISEMAEMVVRKIAEGNIKVEYNIPESNIFGYAEDTKMLLDSSKIRSLGWNPEINLETAYRRLIGSVISQRENGTFF